MARPARGQQALPLTAEKGEQMKVVALNGSPRPAGNSSKVIETLAASLAAEGMETEILQVGSQSIRGCIGCGGCKKTFRCVLPDPEFHELAAKVYAAEGLFIVAPVYYDSMPGQLKTFLDRLFYQDRSGGGLRHKVAAAAAVLRRTGGVSTLDDLNHYFMSSGMLIAPSVGANLVHGQQPGEAQEDLEGMDIIDKLGKNMAWLLRMLAATRESVPAPSFAERRYMNFIRD